MSSRPTIQDVARLAGVSRGTVDRVLNGRAHVREEVRLRVLDAIRQSGYISPRDTHQHQFQQAYPPIRLGVLLPNWEGQFRTEVDQGIAQACAELASAQIQVLTRRCKTDLPAEALQLLDELLDTGVAGIAVCTTNAPSITTRISALAEAGIPCVTFNSDLPESRRMCFVGQDIYKAGRIAGGLMCKCIPAEGQLLAAVGNLKFDGHRQRLSGFCDRMREAGFPSEKIIVAETFNDYETTFRVVMDAIARYPGLCGIYMANLSVSGCAAAIEQAGKKGAIRLICHDLNESIRQLLQQGSIDFTIPQNLRQQGYGPLILLRDFLRKKEAPDAMRFNRQIDIICADNLP